MTDFVRYRDRKFVVVLAVGRSGSTLLQGLLNTLPGYLIRGENFGFLHGLYRAHTALERSRNHAGATTPAHSWYGAGGLDSDAFAADLAPVVARQLLGDRRCENFTAIGFKEIRWMDLNGPHETLWGFLRFIETVFSKAHFILLTRDVAAIMKSGWWPLSDTASMRLGIEAFFATARQAKVRRLFEIDHADLYPGSPRLAGLCDFLGETYRAEMDVAFETKHGF
jgi:hypothetical protein